jgi:hypothetical protein
MLQTCNEVPNKRNEVSKHTLDKMNTRVQKSCKIHSRDKTMSVIWVGNLTHLGKSHSNDKKTHFAKSGQKSHKHSKYQFKICISKIWFTFI